MPPSSSGLGRRPLTAVAGVQIPLGVPLKLAPSKSDGANLVFLMIMSLLDEGVHIKSAALADNIFGGRLNGQRRDGFEDSMGFS